MKTRAIVFLLALLIPVVAFGQIGSYTQDFEGLATADGSTPNSALTDDGWLYFVNVFFNDGGYGNYGVGGAPNTGDHMSAVVEGQGGGNQEMKQLSIFSDYNNQDHNIATIETLIFQERFIDASNVGQLWIMTFDAKMGNLEAPSTATAFVKVIDPNNGFSQTDIDIADMTNIPDTWGGYSVALSIDATWVGQIFQFGFLNSATNFDGSGIFYDNINLSQDGAVAIEESSFGSLKALFR